MTPSAVPGVDPPAQPPRDVPAGPRVEPLGIPGLLRLTLPVHGDDRGWFKENWQREKMVAAGLPDFAPVQQNISFNARRGATRGVHAEPWDKLVSVVSGRVLAAWVDLRGGDTHGRVHHEELGPDTAVYVPRGVGNAYQALEDATTYSYLVNDHWRPDRAYPAVHPGDPDLAIPWPIPLEQAELSAKDRENPGLAQTGPMPPPRVAVVGASGQLGRALLARMPDAIGILRADVDLSDPQSLRGHAWSEYDVVVNAAGHTGVDTAETPEGRTSAWATNATGPAILAGLADEHRFRLVHISSDYVYDGSLPLGEAWGEDAPLAPLGVYGQSKAAGDLAVLSAGRHHVLRTSWVVGLGNNFVRTMADLAARGVSPRVVDDQHGRLTFADELARAVQHVVVARPPAGTYHVSNGGAPATWHEIARRVFAVLGRDPDDVHPVSSTEYAEGRDLGPRPRNSVLDLGRITGTGFEPEDAWPALERYLRTLGDRPAGPR